MKIKKRIVSIMLAAVMVLTAANFYPGFSQAEAEELSDEDTQDIASDTDAEAYAGNDTANGLAGAVQDDIPVVQAVTGKITGTIGGLTGSAYQIDGTTTGYCLQHSKSNYFSDVGGSYVYGTEYWADITNKRITTTLYVGSFKQDLYSGWNGLTSEQRAAMTALACSYYNGDSQDIIYANQLMHDFIDHMTALTAQNVIPYYSDTERYSISASTIKANAQSDGTYYTDAFRLVKTLQQSDDSNTSVSWQMTIPADATYTVRMYNNTSGTGSYTPYSAGQTLTANENNSFRVFSDSPFSTSTLSFSSPNGAYNTAVYTPTNSSYQAVGYCCTLVNNKTLNITLTSDQLGAVAISKSSANPAVTAGSTCYSLQGAVYKMYRSVSDAQSNSNVVATLTTDAGGYAKATNIPFGTYYIKETQAPKGYALDGNIHPVTVTSSHTETNPIVVSVTDSPTMDPVRVLLKKLNSDGQGLSGAEYTFKYYSVQSSTDPAKSGHQPVKTWVVKTGNNGEAYLSNTYKIDGDDFYYTNDGIPALPLGTLTIQETKAPTGYLIDNTVYVRQITEQGAGGGVISYNAPTVTEYSVRGDLAFTKVNSDNEPLANIKFSITSETGESHIVWTDDEGYYSTSSSYALHSKNTNRGEAGDGVWFGSETLDDTKGALPYGTYTIKELRCEANANKYKDLASFTVTVTDNGVINNYGTVVNEKFPNMQTKVKDSITDVNIASLKDVITAIDTVTCKDLEIGHKYTLVGYPVYKDTGARLKNGEDDIEESVSFTATAQDMDVDVSYLIKTDGLAGKDIVFFEYLYDESYPDETIALHTDITNEGQTLHFPEIHTL